MRRHSAGDEVSRRRWPTICAVGAVTGMVAVGYGLPYFGPMISLALPIVTQGLRRQLWTAISRRASLRSSILAWAGLWLPAVLSLVTPLFYPVNFQSSTGWLILPLCGPESTAAWIVPALVAAVLCAGGATLGARRGRSWPFVLSAWLAPWVHQLVMQVMPHNFIC